MGFEPTVSLRSRLISSQVHSTTLPPLRGRNCNRLHPQFCAGRIFRFRPDFYHAETDRNRLDVRVDVERVPETSSTRAGKH